MATSVVAGPSQGGSLVVEGETQSMMDWIQAYTELNFSLVSKRIGALKDEHRLLEMKNNMFKIHIDENINKMQEIRKQIAELTKMKENEIENPSVFLEM